MEGRTLSNCPAVGLADSLAVASPTINDFFRGALRDFWSHPIDYLVIPGSVTISVVFRCSVLTDARVYLLGRREFNKSETIRARIMPNFRDTIIVRQFNHSSNCDRFIAISLRKHLRVISSRVISASGDSDLSNAYMFVDFCAFLCESLLENIFQSFFAICWGYRRCKSCITAISFFAEKKYFRFAFSPSLGYSVALNRRILAISSHPSRKKRDIFRFISLSVGLFARRANFFLAFGRNAAMLFSSLLHRQPAVFFILFRFCGVFFFFLPPDLSRTPGF